MLPTGACCIAASCSLHCNDAALVSHVLRQAEPFRHMHATLCFQEAERTKKQTNCKDVQDRQQNKDSPWWRRMSGLPSQKVQLWLAIALTCADPWP